MKKFLLCLLSIILFSCPVTANTPENSEEEDLVVITGIDMSPFPFPVTPAIPPKITTTSLPGGAVDIAYNQTFNVTGTALINWSISGSLPPGLNLNRSTGLISGTPTLAGTYNFKAMAMNNAGMDTRLLCIIINPAPIPLKIATISLSGGTVGRAYSETLSAAETATITWSFTGSLPPGLSLNRSTGLISGTPSAEGTFDFSATARKSAETDTRPMRIVINSASIPPKVSMVSLPRGTVGRAYSQTFSAAGTTPITWSIASGSLPGGLNLNGTTGLISGTLSVVGTYNFAVTAINSEGSDTIPISIVVNPALIPPKINAISLPGGTVGIAYRQMLNASGSIPIAWSIASGNLPPGLSLDRNTGLISGTPSSAGTFNFTVMVKNSMGTDAKLLNIIVAVNTNS